MSHEPKSAAAYQISLKSDDPRLRYGDETIFKMVAIEFSKIAVFVTWHVSEHGSTCTYQISRQSDNNSWRYSQKTIFNMAAVRHLEFHNFFYKSAHDRP